MVHNFVIKIKQRRKEKHISMTYYFISAEIVSYILIIERTVFVEYVYCI